MSMDPQVAQFFCDSVVNKAGHLRLRGHVWLEDGKHRVHDIATATILGRSQVCAPGKAVSTVMDQRCEQVPRKNMASVGMHHIPAPAMCQSILPKVLELSWRNQYSKKLYSHCEWICQQALEGQEVTTCLLAKYAQEVASMPAHSHPSSPSVWDRVMWVHCVAENVCERYNPPRLFEVQLAGYHNVSFHGTDPRACRSVCVTQFPYLPHLDVYTLL